MDAADRELDVFELAVSDTTSPQLQKQLLVSAVARICAAPSQGTTLQNPLWLSLISRLITKGLSGVEAEQDVVREALFEIIKEDLATRSFLTSFTCVACSYDLLEQITDSTDVA